jgi:cell fate (sporulation/competence/biofilm development) regulator YlbF (YheA/YmcA/DUF963 family)
MADTNEIIDLAGKVGDLIAAHPSVAKYKDAQRAIASDPEATRLMGEFQKLLMNLSAQEQQGLPATEAQERTLQALQTQIASNLRVKALSIAEVDFYDLLRKVNQRMLKPLNVKESAPAGAGQRLAGV